MILGKVVGTVWSTVKWDGLAGLKLLVVRPYEYDELAASGVEHGVVSAAEAADERGIVVADNLDAGVGDVVVVAFGHAARVALCGDSATASAPPDPIDAAVVCIVDEVAVHAG